MFVDSHCHLEFPELAQDLEGVVRRARAAGVGHMVSICTQVTQFEKVEAVANAFPDVTCSVGTHPHEAAKAEEYATAEQLAALSARPKVVAIGEAGLDYFYDHAPREAQQALFREHIRAAMMTGLPLSIHTREAEEDTLRLIREEMAAAPSKKLNAVLHCFSSRRLLAEEGVKLGFYLSLSGMLTFKRSDELREIVRDAPLDRLLIETDSPYLAPVPYRGKTCEPAYVVHTANRLAEVRGLSVAEVARLTTDNFFRLFTKAPKGPELA